MTWLLLRQKHRRAVAAIMALLMSLVLLIVEPHVAQANCGPATDDFASGYSHLHSDNNFVLQSGQPLKFSTTIGNRQSAPWKKLTIRVQATSRPLTTHQRLDRWLDGTHRPDKTILKETFTTSVWPRQSKKVPVYIPANMIHSAWQPKGQGTYGIQVDVLVNEELTTSSRTVVNWLPEEPTPQSTPVAVIAPITTPDIDLNGARVSHSALLQAHNNQGPLAEQLTTASVQGTIWAVDPAILDPLAAKPYTELLPPSHTAALSKSAPISEEQQQKIGAWQKKVLEESKTHDVLLLPYLDPDFTALRTANHTQTYTSAHRLSRRTWHHLTTNPQQPVLAWLDAPSTTQKIIQHATRSGAEYLLLPPPDTTEDNTISPPPSSVNLETPQGKTPAFFANATVLDILDSLNTSAPAHCQADTFGQVPSLSTATAHVLALLAVATPTNPGATPTVITLPKEWRGPPKALTRLTQAVLTAPWVTPATVNDLTPQVTLNNINDTTEQLTQQEPLPAEDIITIHQQIDKIRPVLALTHTTDPTYADRLSTAMSARLWRNRRDQWTSMQTALRRNADAVSSAVRIQPGGPLNIVSTKVDVPVTVINDLALPVTAQLHFTANNARLRPGPAIQFTLPAQTKARQSYPVTAVADGQVLLRGVISTVNGTTASVGSDMNVRIRRLLQSRALLAIGAVLGLLVLVGIVRGIRIDRRHQPTKDL